MLCLPGSFFSLTALICVDWGGGASEGTDFIPLSQTVLFLEEALVVGDVVYAIGPAGGDGSVLGAWALAFERMNG